MFISIYIYAAVSNGNGQRKPRQFSLIHLLFAHHANGSLSSAICSFVNKRKLFICKGLTD